jgi:hypothetical protein
LLSYDFEFAMTRSLYAHEIHFHSTTPMKAMFDFVKVAFHSLDKTKLLRTTYQKSFIDYIDLAIN